jgi:hypothetical protein
MSEDASVLVSWRALPRSDILVNTFEANCLDGSIAHFQSFALLLGAVLHDATGIRLDTKSGR